LWQGKNPIRDLSFTPDGTHLLAFTYGLSGASALTFDLAQGIALRTNSTVGANLHSGIARLSSDKKRLYLSHKNGNSQRLTVKCLEADTGQELWSADHGTEFGMTAMALSPDNQVLVTATGFSDAPIHVWDAATGKLITRLEGHTGWVGELTFSRDGHWLASAAADQTLRLWETSGWTEARVFRGHEDEVHTVAFSPDGRMLASGSKDGSIMLWDTAVERSPYGHRLLPPEVSAIAEYSPGMAVATDTRGRKTVRMQLDDLSETRVSVGSDLSTAFTYLPPNVFAHYEQTNILRVTEYRETGTQLLKEAVGPDVVCRFGAPVAILAHSREHRLIAWSEASSNAWINGSGKVHIVGLDQPVQRWQWNSELRRPAPIAFSPDGKLLLTITTLSASVHSDGASVLPPRERKLEVREVTTGKLVLHSDVALHTPGDIPEHKQPVGFPDAGRKLVVAKQNGGNLEVVFWDLTRPDQPPRRFEERGTLSGLSVSPDGRWVAVGSYAGLLALYDATTMERQSVLHGMLQAVFSVTFSPDSRSLAAGGGGRESVKLWHVETGQELLTLPGKGSLLMDIAFAEGGNTLLLGRFQRPGSWQMWRAPSWEVIHAAEAKDTPSSDVSGSGQPENRQP